MVLWIYGRSFYKVEQICEYINNRVGQMGQSPNHCLVINFLKAMD